jgi:hypothetical protein
MPEIKDIWVCSTHQPIRDNFFAACSIILDTRALLIQEDKP